MALHTLLHMGDLGDIITSEDLAPMMQTNPVVVRRTMAGLRDAGIVRSEKGHGGGWALSQSLDEVTLADVYDALGMQSPLRLGHRQDNPRCLVERAVNDALGSAMAEAEALLLARFRSITVASLGQNVRRNAPQAAAKKKKPHV